MNPSAALLRRIASLPLLVLLLALCLSRQLALGQQTQSQPNISSQLQPVPLRHLYWHFLIHQSDLDAFAAKLNAEGRGGESIRDILQRRLGFSDADYAPIRASSQRLATELKPIQAQLNALQGSAWNPTQALSLLTQRESYIDQEISNLSTELSPKDRAALESFMTTFFAPKNVSATFTAASNGEAVQQ